MKSLPARPNLEFLKKEAKALRALHRQRDTACCERLREHDSAFTHLSDQDIFAQRFSINDAQRIMAREYGYSRWTLLKRYIEQLALPLYHGVHDRAEYHRTITDSYDKRSKHYDNSQWHRDVAIKTVDYCPPETGHRVLDIATGTGTIAFYTAEIVGPEGHVTGVDISQGMIDKCQDKLAQSEHTNLTFQIADAEDLPFPASHFDRIYCSSAFFWMAHPLAALRHWYSLLKPGGYVGFNTSPSDSFFWGDGARRALARHGIAYNCNIAGGTPNSAQELVELAGFENFRLYEVKNGYYMKPEDAKGSLLTLDHYAPGQYPHPLADVPEDIIRQAQQDYEAEIDQRTTEQGVWHDMTQYYVYGQKPVT